MATQTLHIDIAIIGGGIAGLWTLNQLRNQGYSAVLFEAKALGSDQSIAAQGIIHGGIKYALSGVPGSGAQTISRMPARWRDCLAGKGEVDLRDTRLLSEDFYLWSNNELPSRLSALFASTLLGSRAERLDSAQYPRTLQSSRFKGQVYRLDDFVIDIPSLLCNLIEQQRQAIFRIDWRTASLQKNHQRATLAVPGCTVVPQQLILTAGAGNESLIANLGGTEPAMQRRPLQQVLVKHEYPQPFFAHCLGGGTSPRLTVSSHRTPDDEPVWSLGGDLATRGASDTSQQLITKAQAELATLLPWIDLGRTQWRTLQIDRAEPQQARLLRPDNAFVCEVAGVTNALAAWPTKLTLSPDLGDEVRRRLKASKILPGAQPDLSPLEALGHPPMAASNWDTPFQ